MIDLSEKSYFQGPVGRLGDKARDLINDTYVGAKKEGFSIAELYLLLGVYASLLMEAIQVIEDYEDKFGPVDHPRGRLRRPNHDVQRTPVEVPSETRTVSSSVGD